MAASRAKQWPKEANGIRTEAIQRGREAIKMLNAGQKATMHGNHLIALNEMAQATQLLMLIVSELERAGYALRGDIEEQEQHDDKHN